MFMHFCCWGGVCSVWLLMRGRKQREACRGISPVSTCVLFCWIWLAVFVLHATTHRATNPSQCLLTKISNVFDKALRRELIHYPIQIKLVLSGTLSPKSYPSPRKNPGTTVPELGVVTTACFPHSFVKALQASMKVSWGGEWQTTSPQLAPLSVESLLY